MPAAPLPSPNYFIGKSPDGDDASRPFTGSRTPRANAGRHGFEASRDYMQSLARGLVVLRTFDRQHARMSMATIAARARLSRAAVRRIVLTLLHLGYMRAYGREFTLSPRVLELGFGYLGALNLTDLAQPWMEDFSRRLGESSSLAVLDGSDIVYVARVAVRRSPAIALGVGARLPAYCTSMGRVLLAAMPRDQVDAWLQRCVPDRRTPNTVIDVGRIARLVDDARERGFSYVDQEFELGVCALAVPVRNRTGRVCAALSVSVPYHADAQRRAIEQMLMPLRETAGAIERSAPTEWLPSVVP